MVVVDNAKRADARCGEILQGRRSESPGADRQRPRRFKAILPRAADAAQHDMAGIPLDFFRAEFHSTIPLGELNAFAAEK